MADRPRQELAHDATIWQLYLEEANEHDQELVKSLHTSLVMLLLFVRMFYSFHPIIITPSATLFSALLQQAPPDASAALLLLIAQSQQRIELGLPSPTNDPLVDIPAFESPNVARWVDCIWFTAPAL